jgi:hypothetical protein
MMIDCSSTPDLSLYHPQTSMSQNSTSDECKECSPEEIEYRAHAEQSQDFEAYQKDTPVCKQEEDNLAENLQCTAEAW